LPGSCKKLIYLTIISIIVLSIPVHSIGQDGMQSNEDRLSDWAVEEIYAAIDAGLVPEELQAQYQKNITRSQYVLLALRVFDLSGKELKYSEERPFSDVLNHSKETDIVRAYNAGIVKGDGKGHFFPDNEITREEISSLIVNLLMQISPEKNYTPRDSYEFFDGNEISEWAKSYINYCFENQILNGTGKNEQGIVKMSPKDGATIEQSIALIYRLAQKEGLINETSYGTIRIYPEDVDVDAEVIEEFVSTFGESVFNIMKELSLDENIEVQDMRDKSITLQVGKNIINLDQKKFEKNLFGLFFDMNDEKSVNVYKHLLKESFEESEEGIKLFDEYLPQLKNSEPVEIYEEINENYIFVIKSSIEDSGIFYSISYIQPN
jgi:hypothetical protein